MEGSYSKVWNAREEAPTEEYKFFVDSLIDTIRCVASNLLLEPSFLTLLVGTRLRAAKKRPTTVCR